MRLLKSIKITIVEMKREVFGFFLYFNFICACNIKAENN